jgi:hypothetical protein
MPGLPGPRYSGPIRSSSLNAKQQAAFPDYEQRAPGHPQTLAFLASAHYCPYPRMAPASQSSIRRSMRKNVRAMAPAAGSGATGLRCGPEAPLIGLYLREYGKLDVGVRDSHEPCQTVN